MKSLRHGQWQWAYAARLLMRFNRLPTSWLVVTGQAGRTTDRTTDHQTLLTSSSTMEPSHSPWVVTSAIQHLKVASGS
ncbi:uncharacterized protein CCOS01_05318 [Colletotrichum costaricense]|uniref:Uncharacterized protein n=2 Tax=Colletotrichum acutatum species complex TaxID=2707335 RepID=A0AAI9Z0D1_9PEZI|nr:uncharacterized protein CCOS01_05318 [Colletotrichum costaricense]XP_060378264.1 uncharacterized protein CTAM01_11082 [Colletotrichum tamarilloi]KAK1489643.1 hypothetical protein CTAM01_11082 [Colletotrichum tamarilloi]KAK1530215.1 hypothetical protein CCOS01_05318 [Colletotrichum costaricense]